MTLCLENILPFGNKLVGYIQLPEANIIIPWGIMQPIGWVAIQKAGIEDSNGKEQ